MKLLLVEDNPADARLIRELLRDSKTGSFQVQQVASLSAALEQLRYEAFQSVLLDLALPDSYGLQTLAAMQSASHGCPIVILTGLDDEGFALEAMRAGAQDYLVKGRFDSELLARTIRYAVERKRAEEEIRKLNADLERRVAERTAQLERANSRLLNEISEHKRAEAALRISEERFRAVAENVPQMLWVADEDADLPYLSPKWMEYTGTTLEQNLHGGWAKAIHPEDRSKSVEAWNLAVSKGCRYEVEYRLRRHDGEYRWHLSRAVSLERPDQEGVFWFGTTTDIHDRRRTQEALIRSEKLASAGRMAATVAHEINNPLTAALNAIFLAMTDPTITAPVRERLEIAERELERVAHITKQTLGFYRESGKSAAVNLHDIVDDTLALYGPKLKNKSVSVQRRFRSTALAHGIAGELRQEVSNLVTNSIDAVDCKGTLQLRTYNCGLAEGKATMVRLTVADNGCGISQENLKHIFEPFFTTKESIGTGLGLWVTKELIQKHSGRMRVRSRLRKGTVFSIWIPADRRRQARESETAEQELTPDKL